MRSQSWPSRDDFLVFGLCPLGSPAVLLSLGSIRDAVSSQQIPLNLAQVSEGGHCLCIVGCAGLYLLSISIFTFLRLVTVLMKGCCKQTRGRRLCGHTAVTAMWSPAWCVCAAALARSIHKYVLSSCCMPGIGLASGRQQ